MHEGLNPVPRESSTGSGLDIEGTLIQSSEALAESKDLSIPSDVIQAQEAPKVPGYVLTALIGQGSFARVWKAWQVRTRKVVALKVFTSRAGVNWVFLQREMERLARIDKHPHVVSLLDADLAGQTAWYATELLEGGSLEKFMNPASPVPAARVAAWMEEIAAALSFVHGKGIIHCDLKPGNVLLDESGHVRVADFGQARVMGESSGGLGTLFYMPPEQAVLPKEGEAQVQPDVRWDVYALGATAYALLTGTAPHAGTMTEALSSTATVADRLEVYRVRVKASPLADLEGRKGLDRDLAAIVGKCLASGPDDRYANADALAADLAARRGGLPVSPLRQRRAYRLRKFVRRNAAAVMILALALGGLAASAGRLLVQHATVRQQLAQSLVLRAQQFADQGDDASAALCYARANEIVTTRAAETNALAYLNLIASPLASIECGDTAVTVVEFCVSASRAYVGTTDGGMIIVDLARNLSTARIQAHVKGEWVESLASAPDGRLVATGGGAGDRSLRVWDGVTGAAVAGPFAHEGKVRSVVFGRDGASLYSLDGAGTVRRWSVERRGVRLAAESRGVKLLASGILPRLVVSRDGRLLAVPGEKMVTLFESGTLKRVGQPVVLKGVIMSLAFEPGGSALAIGTTSDLEAAVIVDLRKPGGRPTVLAHDGQIPAMAFSPDGTRLITGCSDGVARVWNTRTWEREFFMRHGAWIEAVAFSPDGSLAITGGRDGIARLWNPATGRIAGGTMRHGGAVKSASLIAADPPVLLTLSEDRVIRKWLLKRTGSLLRELRPRVWAFAFAISPAADRVFAARTDQLGMLWDPATGSQVGPDLVLEGAATGSSFSPDGSVVAVLELGGRVSLWDARSGGLLGRHALPGDVAGTHLFVMTGRDEGVVSDERRALRKWVVGKSALERVAFPHDAIVLAAAASRDARTLATIQGSKVIAWDLETANRHPWRCEHQETVLSAVFSADGRYLLTGGNDRTARMWDLATGEAFGRPIRHDWGVPMVGISSDGRTIATGTYGFMIRLWDAATGQRLGMPLMSDGPTAAAGFSADGKTLVTASESTSVVQVWDVHWLAQRFPPRELTVRVRAATGMSFDAAGQIVVAAPSGRP